MVDDIKLPEPFATLHDDGYWTMPRGAEPCESRGAGWRQHVYSADQLRAAVEAERARRVPLTDEQIKDLCLKAVSEAPPDVPLYVVVSRAIDAAHNITAPKGGSDA